MTNRTLLLTLTIVSVALAQCGSNPACGQACYDPTAYTCATDGYTGKPTLCPKNSQSCNGGCYDASSYWCNNGQLAQGQAPQAVKATTSTSAAVKATTSSVAAKATTSSVAAKATTSSVAVKTTTSSVAVKATTSAAQASTSSSSATPIKTSSSTAAPTTSSSSTTQATTVAASAAAATSCQSMFQNLKCRTFSQDPSQVNTNDVANSRNWLCSTYPQYCTQINGGQWSSCNSVEQLSFAMDAYYAAKGPDASACSFGGIGRIIGAAASTTAAAPVVGPTPSPYPQFPAQTADLRIINNCKSQLWFEARYGGAGAPLPGQSATSIQALPGSYVDYVIPDTGLSGTRFWAKYGCDNNGKGCLIGDQMQYFPNPPGGCPPGGCTPPVDSLFEATWGCRPGSSCNAQNPTTWFDTSQVDGWTIPYKLTPIGDTSGCDCNGPNCGFKGVDASTLDLAKCPQAEDLTAGGAYKTINVLGNNVSLSSVDLRIVKGDQVLGCMSPCKRLNWGYPYGLQQDESHGSTLWMCCPTPNPDDCKPENGCVSPLTCRAGPIENTQFVAAVHSMAPGVYSYSYDDGVGLHACPAGVTKYTMEFCPAGSAPYPGTV